VIAGHGLAGVQLDLVRTQTARLFIGQGQQPGADPAILRRGSELVSR
jgi:hypothetical protein